MSRPRILLLGAGGHARACIDVIEREDRFTIMGLLGMADEVGTTVLGHTVLGVDEELPRFASECGHAMISSGQIKTPEVRIRLFGLLERAGFDAPVVVSPGAYVSPHARLGAGTIVMHGAVVNAGAVVGRNCILNTQSLVEHDVGVADHCHVSTHAVINSGVRVGAGTFVGSGATVRQGIVLGERCVIGMGARVLRDCEPGSQLPPRKTA